MKKLILIILCGVFAGGFCASGQKSYSVGEIPNTRLRDAGSYVSNPDGILSPETVRTTNQILGELYTNTGIEVAVVVVGSINSDDPEDFAVDLFRSWGIGQKGKDNGLLILLVTNDRFVRFEVGYGLEGDLPDAIAKRIQTTRMLPYLRSGDWNDAVIAAVDGVYEYLNDPNSDLRYASADAGMSRGSIISRLIFIFGGLGLIMFFALMAQRRSRRCPRCKHQMKVSGTTETRISPTIMQITTVYHCPNCGYNLNKSNMRHIQSGGGFGGYMGPFGGGSGGGMGGGSWGGGRSGGGGATTRF